MTTALTPLERELLSYVDALTRASEQSARALSDLERRSTGQIEQRLRLLEDCTTRLLSSQDALSKALLAWLSESATYDELESSLQQSRQELSAATRHRTAR